jgi:hypothetical protein
MPEFLTFDVFGMVTSAEYGRRFGCLATVGTGGCGFEQQLEAALKGDYSGSDPVLSSSSTDWVQTLVCLPPRLAGSVRTLKLRVLGRAGDPGPTDTTFPSESIFVDDMVLGTDMSCPTE